MITRDTKTTDLTRNQSLVLNVLANSQGPLSAYAILDCLRDEGIRAPLQIYRALDRLIALEKVHRLESLNAFVACSHPESPGHHNITFTICEDCGQVDELTNHDLDRQLLSFASDNGFEPSKATIELKGTCQDCRVQQ